MYHFILALFSPLDLYLCKLMMMMMKNPVGEDDVKGQGRKIFQGWKLRLGKQWMLDLGSIFLFYLHSLLAHLVWESFCWGGANKY